MHCIHGVFYFMGAVENKLYSAFFLLIWTMNEILSKLLEKSKISLPHEGGDP